MNFYLLFFFYFVTILSSIFLYIKISQKYNICQTYDSINKRKIIQSIGILIIFLLPLFILTFCWIYPNIQKAIFEYTPRPIVFIFNIVFLGLISLYDDIKLLDFRYRLVVQFLAAFLSLSLFVFPITEFLPIKLEQLFIIFVIIFVINTSNFYDGLDGMLNINTIFVCLTILVVSYFEQKFYVSTIIAIALLPIVISILPFNFPIAKVFMGDSGSVVIGYATSIIMIDLIANKLYWILLIIYFIPSIDVIFTILKKIFKKINLWERLFDYMFLVPVIKFKKKHTYTTIPFAACSLANLFLVIASYHFEISNLLFINFITSAGFLIYCSNFSLFVKYDDTNDTSKDRS